MSAPVLFGDFKISDKLPLTDVAFGSDIGEGLNIQKQEVEPVGVPPAVANLFTTLSLAQSDIGTATIEPVSALPVLPSTDWPQGRVVFLLSDNKLYRSTGATWTTLVNGADIAVNSITTNMIVAGAVTASRIASHTITANEIAAATITATEIAAATITATQIAAATIVAANIASGTITTLQLSAVAIDGMTITGATFRTASSNPKVEITTANGFRGIDSSGNVLTQITTGGVLSLKTAPSGAHIELDATNGLRGLDSSSNVLTQLSTSGVLSLKTASPSSSRVEIDATNGFLIRDSGGVIRTQVGVSVGTFGGVGFIHTHEILGISGLTLAYDDGFNLATLALSTAQFDFSAAGSVVLRVNGAVINAVSGAVFTGNGSGLTALNATNLSTGTVADARLSTAVVLYGGAAISGNISVVTGSGMTDGSTRFMCSTTAKIFNNSILQAQFDDSSGATQTSTLLLGDGSLRRVSIDNTDLGSGAKRYLYLA